VLHPANAGWRPSFLHHTLDDLKSRAGQTIRAESEAGLIRFRCKLTVDPA
jgi:hypothetical protein